MEEFMMKIAVVASNGKASRAIIEELVARGHEVTAFARHENQSAAKHFVQKDILDLTKGDLAGFDAVVDGFGAFTPETLPLHTKTSQHLMSCYQRSARHAAWWMSWRSRPSRLMRVLPSMLRAADCVLIVPVRNALRIAIP